MEDVESKTDNEQLDKENEDNNLNLEENKENLEGYED
jgi:hypothetical protein